MEQISCNLTPAPPKNSVFVYLQSDGFYEAFYLASLPRIAEMDFAK